MQKYIAELIGTFWLVLAGLGVACLASSSDYLGVSILSVSLAFGLTMTVMHYVLGHVSGCHLNPAVSLGLFFAKRFEGRYLLPYIIAQMLGGILAVGALFLIALQSGFDISSIGNGFTGRSLQSYSRPMLFLGEVISTAIFVLVFIVATNGGRPSRATSITSIAPILIGLTLSIVYIVMMPLSNGLVNPAHSIGAALFADGWIISQLWIFFLAPFLGSFLGAMTYKIISTVRSSNVTVNI